MARIPPVDETSAPPASRSLASEHLASGGRMTNMKWTLAHSPAALDALLQWYPLHDELVPVLGERRVWVFCHAISAQSDCLICSTFFRRLLIDAGEDPASPALDEFDQVIADLGRRLVVDPHSVDDALFAALSERLTPPQIVSLMAFGAMMVATNVFNDAMGVELDSYLEQYAA
jgi:alkylhydroperoxidase family enzyme